jgi:hypothetical protein
MNTNNTKDMNKPKCCIRWGCHNYRNNHSGYCDEHIGKKICEWGLCHNNADNKYCKDHIDKQQCPIIGCFNISADGVVCNKCCASEWGWTYE